MRYEIKSATAQYTGGNIYIYYGELENGLYFRACDGEEFIEICNADTSADEADYCEFYIEHSVETITGDEYKEFWNVMLSWIIHNAPKGNYQADELDRRMFEPEEPEEETTEEKMMRKINMCLEIARDNFTEWNESHSNRMARINGMIEMLEIVTNKEYIITEKGLETK